MRERLLWGMGLSLALALWAWMALRGRPQQGVLVALPPTSSSASSSPMEGPWFREVSEEVGIRFVQGHGGKRGLNILETVGTGCAFLDFDNDGWLDVLLVGEHQLALYRNLQGKGFEDLTPPEWRNPPGWWIGCAVGDYDNDGWADVYLSGYRCSWLLHNEGGKFREVGQEVGVRNRERWESSALFADFDRDGWLDLYVGAYLHFGQGWPELCPIAQGIWSACPPSFYDGQVGRLYRNRGDGTFQDITQRAGLERTRGKTLGVAAADYNEDGLLDLYLANDGVACDLFRNLGDGRFVNEGVLSGTAFNAQGLPQAGMGCDWGDVNGDGRLDLVVGTFHHEPLSLYRNEGGGFFSEVGNQVGLYEPTLLRLTFGVKFVDVQNDGTLDLVLTNGHIQDNIHLVDTSATYAQPPQLFLNRGDGTFQEAPAALAGEAFRRPIVGRGLAVGDYDNDGDVDLLWMDLEGKASLLRNEKGQGASFLQVRLLDPHGRDAIGAQVWVHLQGRRLLRICTLGGSYLSAHDPWVHFGLGEAQRVERLEIRWPDGRRTVREGVAARQRLVVREGE